MMLVWGTGEVCAGHEYVCAGHEYVCGKRGLGIVSSATDMLGMSVMREMRGVVSLDSLCRWQVHVYVYCARRIFAHLRYTQCSILLHLIDICFLPCIFLWHISQIQTCLRVIVGPGFVSTSHDIFRGAVPAIQRVRMAGLSKKSKSDGRNRHNLHISLAKPL